jgi:hypothetical protein
VLYGDSRPANRPMTVDALFSSPVRIARVYIVGGRGAYMGGSVLARRMPGVAQSGESTGAPRNVPGRI